MGLTNKVSDVSFLSAIAAAAAVLACLLGAGPATAQARYSYANSGAEVVDSKTGLTWRRCAEGMAWSGSTCTGTASTYTHEAALQHAKAQMGAQLWRLPNRKELTSIVDRSRRGPAIDTTAFPATPNTGFWSASPYVGNADRAWDVGFNYGNVYYGSRSVAWPVRLVRASQ